MDLNTKLEFVLGLNINPSQKVGLISLLYADKPVTTVELNRINNCSKTFDNYKVLFADFINNGLIDLQTMKDYRGTTRQHFVLNSDILESLIEEI